MHLLLAAQLSRLVDVPDPTGLARGRYPAPAWAIWLVAGGVVLLALLIVGLRHTRARRNRNHGSGPGTRP